MRFVALLCSLLVLLPSGADAKVTKADCKAHAAAIDDLAKALGLTPGIKGRGLINAVDAWIESQDEPAIRSMIGRIDTTTSGIEACNDSGYSSFVLKVKGTSQKLRAAVMPALQDTAAADPCQGLINQAIRKRGEDIEGAIADLERSTGECQDNEWMPEAHRNLVELYYERGDPARDDLNVALGHTRKAMGYLEDPEAEQARLFVATLARSTIEAGAALMEERDHEQAKAHWRAYMDIFGTSSFDVLFDVEQIAQGAWMLRELGDARYQLVVACLESGDLECVRENILPRMAEYESDMRPVKELTETILQRAADGTQSDEFFVLGFDLLTEWNELDPGAFQVNRILEQTFLGISREERLELLRLTDKCWIPMHVAEALRQEDENYLEEVEVAASCGDSAGEALQILADFHLKAAQDKLDRLGAWSIAERRKVLNDVEKQLLPKLGDSPEANAVRSRISSERGKIRNELARAEKQKEDAYDGCTQLLATIQWNRAREEEFDNEMRDFKKACCPTLRGNASGWGSWMRSRPENTRLEDEEIENKLKLMKRYCQQ